MNAFLLRQRSWVHRVLMARAGTRRARYDDFDAFSQAAPRLYRQARRRVSGADYYKQAYDFYVVAGGIEGANSPRLVDVFFGSRPFDSNVRTHGAPVHTRHAAMQLHAERGALLRYEQLDSGEVICSLWGARTTHRAPREDFFLLDTLRNPAVLQSPGVIRHHLRWLIAQMGWSSLDGIVLPWHYLRIVRLWGFRRRGVDGRVQPTRAWNGLLKVGGWVFTVALSGCVLYFVQREWPLPDASPAVDDAARRAHADAVHVLRAVQASTTSPETPQVTSMPAAGPGLSPVTAHGANTPAQREHADGHP